MRRKRRTSVLALSRLEVDPMLVVDPIPLSLWMEGSWV